LSRTYPDAPEVSLYLGVCDLFLGRAGEAISAFSRAERAKDPRLRQAALWFLSLAYQRAGQAEAMKSSLLRLCEESGEDSTRACEVLTRIGARPKPSPGKDR